LQDEIRDVRARPSGRALRRVLPVGLLTMLASPVLIVWEVYALLLMGLVALVWPAWRARSTDVRWGMLLGVLPYLASGRLLRVRRQPHLEDRVSVLDHPGPHLCGRIVGLASAAMDRPSAFAHHRFIGDKRTQQVYDLDEVADEETLAIVVDELMSSERFLCFGPDTLAEARNRGYRLRAV